jgi:histone-lysine N-methyltransferase SETMAR
MAAPQSTCTTIEQRGVVRFLWAKNMEHPPYSPDLAPSDFHLFGPLKHHLSGESFPDDDAVE